MISVYIAHSDREWLNKVKREIPWQEMNCKLTGTGTTFAIARNALTKQGVDLLITDIELKGAGPLELCEYAKLQSGQTTVVVVSAWERFEYAVKALNMGIKAFYPQSLSMKELTGLLQSVVDQINRRNFWLDQLNNAEDPLKQNIQFYSTKVLPMLFSGMLNEEDIAFIAESFKKNGYELENRSFVTLEFAVEGMYQTMMGAQEISAEIKKLHLTHFRVARISDTILGGVVGGETDEEAIDRAYEIVRKILEIIDGMDYRNVYMGISDPVKGPYGILTTTMLARQRMLAAGNLGKRLIGPREQVTPGEAGKPVEYKFLYEMTQYLTPDQLSPVFSRYLAAMRMIPVPEQTIKDYMRIDACLSAARIVIGTLEQADEVLAADL